VGGTNVPANQSLRGLILRLDPSAGRSWILAAGVVVALAGIALAVLASRRGDESKGFSLCALTGLLVSPVSWTHHWTLAVPALLLLGIRVLRERSGIGRAAVGAILLLGYSYLPKLMAKPAFSPAVGKSLGWTLVSAPYVVIGCAALGVACLQEARGLAADQVEKRRSRHRNARPASVHNLASPEMAPDLGVTRT
jgi:alpha-1,2-mannosyltransferase